MPATSVGERTGNSVPLVLKGDANDVPDAAPYVVTDVERVLADAPYLGYLVAWSSTPTALAAGIILAAALLVIAFRPQHHLPRGGSPEEPPATTPIRPARPDGPRHALGEWRTGAPVVALALTAVLAFAEPSPARAAFTDITAGQITLTMGTAPRPASFTCTNTGVPFVSRRAVLTWPVVGPNYRYRLVYKLLLTGAELKRVEVPAQASGTVTHTTETSVGDLLPPTFNISVYTLVGTNWIPSDPTLTQRVDKSGNLSLCGTEGTVTTAASASAREARTAPSSSGAPSASESSTTESSSPAESSDAEPSTGATPDRPETPAEPERGAAAPNATSTSPRGYDAPVT